MTVSRVLRSVRVLGPESFLPPRPAQAWCGIASKSSAGQTPIDDWGPYRVTGARGTRTPDLLHAMQTRSQLRHGPATADYGPERSATQPSRHFPRLPSGPDRWLCPVRMSARAVFPPYRLAIPRRIAVRRTRLPFVRRPASNTHTRRVRSDVMRRHAAKRPTCLLRRLHWHTTAMRNDCASRLVAPSPTVRYSPGRR